METGIVKAWKEDRGFGFIATDKGDDLFVHVRQIRTKNRTLMEGERVRFRREETSRGTQAFEVVPASVPDVISENQLLSELSSLDFMVSDIALALDWAKSHGWVT